MDGPLKQPSGLEWVGVDGLFVVGSTKESVNFCSADVHVWGKPFLELKCGLCSWDTRLNRGHEVR